jgi:hypothetical protein
MIVVVIESLIFVLFLLLVKGISFLSTRSSFYSKNDAFFVSCCLNSTVKSLILAPDERFLFA